MSLLQQGMKKALATGYCSQRLVRHLSQWSSSATNHSALHGALYVDERCMEEDHRLRVILDLDECLIHGRVFASQLDAALYQHQMRQRKRQQQPSSMTTPTQASFRTLLPGGAHVQVWMRPGLIHFLQQCTQRYATYIFTVSMPAYANPILDHLCLLTSSSGLSTTSSSSSGSSSGWSTTSSNHSYSNSSNNNNIFAGRFYRPHCTWDARRGAFIKDLSTLPLFRRHLHRTVLIDNNPDSFLAQPENGILVDSFYNEQPPESVPLFPQLLQQLHALEGLPDVRTVLNARVAPVASSVEEQEDETRPMVVAAAL